MLVILRREGECLYIGDSVKIIFKQIEEKTVKLLIDAPREIAIHRYGNFGQKGRKPIYNKNYPRIEKTTKKAHYSPDGNDEGDRGDPDGNR